MSYRTLTFHSFLNYRPSFNELTSVNNLVIENNDYIIDYLIKLLSARKAALFDTITVLNSCGDGGGGGDTYFTRSDLLRICNKLKVQNPICSFNKLIILEPYRHPEPIDVIHIKYSSCPRINAVYIPPMWNSHWSRGVYKWRIRGESTSPTGVRSSRNEYLNELNSYTHCLVLPGYVCDTYRLWECIDLGIIPVLPRKYYSSENFLRFLIYC